MKLQPLEALLECFKYCKSGYIQMVALNLDFNLDVLKCEYMIFMNMAHLFTARAVTSAGTLFVIFKGRRAVASHSRSVRSADAERSRWCSPLSGGGDGAKATAVTLYSDKP